MNTPITVYGQPSCQPCRLVQRRLDRDQVPYDYVDLTQHPDKLEQLRDAGMTQTPIIETPTDRWSGLDPDRLNRAIEHAQADMATTAQPSVTGPDLDRT
ncbi:glutaredoxin-like protein NrdH [Micrococcus cohnii]|uniref:Glutaredoxin-like protein NrdH n=1 Tax=Micrococcus cohnii TaxID=993416 RepID=A0A7W7M273_9MICC|nr:glutaredoxin family protein [Micrococcus cohnii]MBB4734733.1 glutaredoxin-like protein NrdH [Micrococcus cohnii]